MHQLTAIALLILAGTAAGAGTDDYRREDAVAISQAAVGGTLGEYVLRDTAGQPFDIAKLRGKPLIVSMIYTSCHHVCPMITKNLGSAIDVARDALGDDAFTAVTIGFDWAVDTPDRMRVYAAERRIEVPNWYFLAGDEATIDGLTRDLGFLFYPSAKGFDHLTQTTIVDRDGKVYRQIYGVDLDPPTVVEPLKELVFDTPRQAGLVDHWVDRFRLFCTVFDPNSGRYRFDYSIVMTIFVGLMCLLAIAGFLVHEWRRAR